MQKLANISQFEALMNQTPQCSNAVFNKEYPKSAHPFREGFRSGFDAVPWVYSYNPMTLPLWLLSSLLVKAGTGTINGLKKKIKHPSHTKKRAKELEAVIQQLLDAGKKPEAQESCDELKKDFASRKMNRDQYIQLLEELFYDNGIYRSSDYDDPDDLGEEPYQYEGPSLYEYFRGKVADDMDSPVETDEESERRGHVLSLVGSA